MGTTIYRGSTPVIKFKVLNDVTVSELGTPSIAIAQELVYLTPEVTVNAADNSITAKLTEDETLSLVEGVETSVQEIWQQADGTIIRYPVHALTVAETIMEEVNPEPEPEPGEDLKNLHPFMIYSPFESNGYFSEYLDDGGTAVEQWRNATTPWTDSLDGYLFWYDISQDPSLADYTIIPLCVSSVYEGYEYYLWLNSGGGTQLDVTIEVGDGYSFATANGSTTATVTLRNNDALVRLVGTDAALGQPMFNLNVQASGTGESELGMALYAIIEGASEATYRQYIPYDGGDV